MNLRILGAPRTKKTSNRVLRFGRFNKVVPSAAWLAWRDIAVPQLRLQWAGRAPIDQSINVAAVFYRDAKRGDAVGYYQSLADVLQEAGVVIDDKVITSWDGSRLSKDALNARVEVEIWEAEMNNATSLAVVRAEPEFADPALIAGHEFVRLANERALRGGPGANAVRSLAQQLYNALLFIEQHDRRMAAEVLRSGANPSAPSRP
jgi:Holliday junction resolvase RusA-like endonuclease